MRLTQRGYDYGVVKQERYDKFSQFRATFEKSVAYLDSIVNSMIDWKSKVPSLPCEADNPVNKSILDLLRIDSVQMETFARVLAPEYAYLLEDKRLAERIKIHCVYADSARRQANEINEIRANESIQLPADFDYAKLNLSRESCEKLLNHRPTTLGAASRIPGITPSTLFNLLTYFKNHTDQYVKLKN